LQKLDNAENTLAGGKLARAKLSKALKNNYVRTAILGIILLGSVLGFWFGFKAVLRTEYPFLAVASGSMMPTLNRGDLIIVQGVTNASEIYAASAPNGTIIVFFKPNDPSELIVHRAINKVENNGLVYLQTKGDNNPGPDFWTGPSTNGGLISMELLIGKVVGWVPWLGNVPLFLRTPQGMLVIVLLFLVILFIEYVPWLAKKAKTKG